MSLLTPSQSVLHKRFHQCVIHKKKLSLRHLLPTFGSFSFFQTSLWLGVDKFLQKLTKSYKSEIRLLYQWCILIPRKCLHKTPFQHTVQWGPNQILADRLKSDSSGYLCLQPEMLPDGRTWKPCVFTSNPYPRSLISYCPLPPQIFKPSAGFW